MANDIIDINVYETTETVAITVNPNLTTVNVNQVTGGGGVTNLSTTQTASNFTINSDTGDDAIVPLGNGTLAGATLNDYTTAEKTKLSGIETGAEVNVNADWNAVSGDAQILNKPTIPASSPITIVNNNSLFSTGLIDTGENSTATNSIFLGDGAGYGTTTANNSNFIGAGTGYNASYANDSNFIGTGAGIGASSANNSNFFGKDAGTNASGANNSNLLGYKVGKSFTDNNISSNNIIIGTNISLPNAAVDSINLGGVLFGTGTHSDISGDPSITPILGGKIGIGVVDPTNTLHIYSETANTSGLRLERLTSASPSSTGKLIGVDSSGNVVTLEGAGGGGSSVNYYLNGGTSQGTFGGTTYYEFSKTPVIGTGADFNRNTNGYIASFITDVADPSLLLIPAGNWNLEFFFSSSSAGGSPSFYAELYKYDGTTFTLIASGSAAPEGITNGTAIDAYFTALAVPETVLTVNDRLAIRVYVNASSKTITLHTQNGHLCEVITTFSTGLTALNGLQAQVQNFATGTTGTDFAINSSGSTHTFNLPDASATARGAITTGTQTIAGAKTFNSPADVPITALSQSEYGIFAGSDNNAAIFAQSLNGDGIQSFALGGGIGIHAYSDLAAGGVFETVTGSNIAEFKTSSVLKAYINSVGTVIGTGLNASGQTINTIASFDAGKNVVSLSTATYPSLTELALLKGVSGSSVQTQLDGKVSTNTAITGATNTKITYDAKGLVTAGTTLIESDIPTLSQSKVTNLTTDLTGKISKNIATTYTTNTITTVTAAEYAAIGTKDATTLYFIV